MPDKIILETRAEDGGIASVQSTRIHVEMDGVRHEIRRCTALHIVADSHQGSYAELRLLTANCEAEVLVTRENAEAILRADATRQLAFLDDAEAHELRKLLAALGGELASSGGSVRWGEERKGIDVLRKIIAELARREEIPF